MEIFFQEIDLLMSDKDKIAEIRRTMCNISEYQKFAVASKVTAVLDMRTLISDLAALYKASNFENRCHGWKIRSGV